MTMRRAPWLLVVLATHVNAQFVETSEQYKEAMELSVRSRRPAVLRCLHAIDARRLQE